MATDHPKLRPPLHLRQHGAPRPQRAPLPHVPIHLLVRPRRGAHRLRRRGVELLDGRLAAGHRRAAHRPRRRRP
ncbi:hypothetical protein HU200_003369 [Digitaria exilis]|uniref:Uncharacterized protein n=1 Tax=Digitaria exilis TaxID=1010633 RepID=A0A835FVF0_9POAL|nr:hypothetical protein HU200_003369 [Digitaria exilis]